MIVGRILDPIIGPENIRVRQQRNRILRVLPQAFERGEQEGPVFANGEAYGPAELLATQRILDWLPLSVGIRWIEHIAWLQRLTGGKGIADIHSIIAEEAIETSSHLVCAGLGDDVDGRAACSTQLRRIIAAIDLKLLHGILADR